MAKIGKKPTDDQMLEGGGAGAGMGKYKSLPRKSRNPDEEFLTKAAVGLGTPAAATGVALAVDRLSKNRTPYDELPKKDTMTAGQKESMQEAKDEEMRKKMKTAPTTKTEMGKGFAKGGMTASKRADGCAQRGKTRGTMI
jgi:hypothetical protein